MIRRIAGATALALLAALPHATAPQTAQAGLPLFGFPKKSKPPVVLLAEMIDDLEESLNDTGTIVAKKPDVWGESRLTKHRQEVEEKLAAEIDNFKLLLNASSAVSDQAFLANALAISAALGSNQTFPRPRDGAQDGTSQSLNIYSVDSQISSLTPSATLDNDGRITNNAVIVRTDPSQFPLTTAMLGQVNTEEGKGGFYANRNLSLEPTLRLDQLKRYLDHLNELRRLNEGGDTADAPGYSLNLVRIPVSVMPGDDTRKGHGAEITVTAEMHLTRELLPTTFRSMVINDLVDQLSLPLLKLAEIKAWRFRDKLERADRLKDLLHRLECLREVVSANESNVNQEWIEKEWIYISIQLSELVLNDNPASPFAMAVAPLAAQGFLNTGSHEVALDTVDTAIRGMQQGLDEVYAAIEDVENALQGGVTTLPLSASSSRIARHAIAPSRISDVYGKFELITIAEIFSRSHSDTCGHRRQHLSDVRAFLAEELQSAYDFLSLPESVANWECVSVMVNEIRGGIDLTEQRHAISGKGNSVTQSLAWAILVEAALLDQRLNEDLQRVVHDPECECMITGPQCFYLPDPPEEARQAFMDYVRCRWPIHVFALDPQTQDQNVAEAFSMRRELQLVAALAFASGRMTASNTLRFARRLELEEQAIALNRTAIAFAHGANTFGWRFRPRFQTMDIESNAVTVGRDLLWGGPSRDARMKNWRIEPGMRECVALVVMPSFVPHVRFDVRSHWFKLHNHDNIKGEMTDTMKLSSKIAEAQQLMEFCHLEAENYRPGEIERLHARVKQLSDRLPLQTLFAQVPYENTAGGFELFSSGVTDLGPELTDFYGAPGIDPSVTSTLFLVGKNFSVHQTRLIAGNVEVPARNIELLSRDVMKVTIPPGVRTVMCKRSGVDVRSEVMSPAPVTQSQPPVKRTAAVSSREKPAIIRVGGTEDMADPLLSVAADEPVAPTLPLLEPVSTTFTPISGSNSSEAATASPSGGCPQCTGMGACSTCGPHGPVASDTYEAVELHLATPYGVSGRLLVPVVSQSPPVSAMPCNLTWFPSATAVEYFWNSTTNDQKVTTYFITSIRPVGDSLVLHSPEGLRLQDQSNVDVVAEMQVLVPDMGSVGFDSFTLSEKRKLVATPEGYALEGAEFHKFHMNLSTAIHTKLSDSKAPINFERVSQIRVKLHFSLASGNIAPVVTAPLIVDVQLTQALAPE